MYHFTNTVRSFNRIGRLVPIGEKIFILKIYEIKEVHLLMSITSIRKITPSSSRVVEILWVFLWVIS